jgi:hypothetical protein
MLCEEPDSENFFKAFDDALKLIPLESDRHAQVFWERAAFVHTHNLELTISGRSKLSDFGIKAYLELLLRDGLVNLDKAIAYLKSRTAGTENPFFKAKFSFTVWHVKKEPEYATLAVKSYVACARRQLENKQYGDVYRKFMTAFFIARLRGFETTRKDLGTSRARLQTTDAN